MAKPPPSYVTLAPLAKPDAPPASPKPTPKPKAAREAVVAEREGSASRTVTSQPRASDSRVARPSSPPAPTGGQTPHREVDEDEAPAKRNRPMESKAAPTMLYLHPDGKRDIKLYAINQGDAVRVHDLLMEAVEEWAAKRGLKGPFRVPSLKPRRSR